MTEPNIKYLDLARDEALHAISHALGMMAQDLHALRKMAEEHGPMLSAYQRGGLLAARKAAKVARNGDTP